MENNPVQPTPAAPTTPPVAPSAPQPTTPPPPPVKKDGTNRLLMIIIGIILLGSGLLGGYLIASQNNQPAEDKMSASPTVSPSAEPTEELTPTTTSQNTKTVKAGLTTSPYTVQVPVGWTDVRENTQTASIDKLTLSKNGYTLTIYQAAMGGGGCLYPGDAPAEMSQTFTDFAEIKGTTETFRRSWNQTAAKTISYGVCKKGTDGSYGIFSSFGAISAVSPNPAEATILSEIDAMIASLAKQ